MGAILAAWAPSNPPDVGSVPKGVATLFFSNKEPSKTSVWLPCSGHVQEQKRLPPWLANDSTCGLQGSRLPWGFMLRACLCGVRARVHAGSCREANMTLSDIRVIACVMPACACAACVLVSVQNLATGHLAGASAAYGFNGPNTSWQTRHLGPPFHCLPWLDSALGPRG